MIPKNIKDALYPFSPMEKQTLITVYNRGLEYGATIEELVSAITEEISDLRAAVIPVKRQSNLKPKAKARTHLFCPECSAPVAISKVNDGPKCTAIGGEWKTLLVCTNNIKRCQYTKLSKKSVQELVMGGGK